MLRPVKRRRRSVTIEVVDDNDATPSDVEVALSVLRREFHPVVGAPPLILVSQLQSLVTDSSAVDRELDELRCRGVIRLLELSIGPDDQGFVELITQAATRAEDTDDEAALLAFKACLPRHRGPGISPKELCEEVPQGPRALISAGILVLRPEGGYRFTAPWGGTLMQWCAAGRAEMLSLVRRKRFKQLPKAELEGYKMRRSKLGTLFHMRDLIGKGLLRSVHSPGGEILRLVEE